MFADQISNETSKLRETRMQQLKLKDEFRHNKKKLESLESEYDKAKKLDFRKKYTTMKTAVKTIISDISLDND